MENFLRRMGIGAFCVLLLACPGRIDSPENFVEDGGVSTECDVENGIFQNRCGGACHVADGQPPDLVSPNVSARIVGVTSSCDGRPMGPHLVSKVKGEQPMNCGFRMPAEGLSAAEIACVEWYIQNLLDGGAP